MIYLVLERYGLRVDKNGFFARRPRTAMAAGMCAIMFAARPQSGRKCPPKRPENNLGLPQFEANQMKTGNSLGGHSG
jgi:hypothetical protein